SRLTGEDRLNMNAQQWRVALGSRLPRYRHPTKCQRPKEKPDRTRAAHIYGWFGTQMTVVVGSLESVIIDDGG
ncbi:MAG TPA: hypothetical protein VJ728_08465, partial [Candidatus Binataceae bacterium]|nr:hypothetical protein [Candidatus Binataceae bacterium]